jgi:putative ABC transport system permease protein
MNLRSTVTRLLNLFRRNNRDLDAELDAHLDLAIEQNLHSGMSPEEARRQALFQLGGIEQTKERVRDQQILPWLDSLRADAVFGYRQLAKNKITSLAAILSLALAIGSYTAAFRLVDAIFFRPLPASHPYRLYALTRVGIGPDGKPQDFDGWAYPDFQLMREATGKDADLNAIAYSGYTDLTYKTDQDMEKAQIQCVSGNMFPVFGLQPAQWRCRVKFHRVENRGRPEAGCSCFPASRKTRAESTRERRLLRQNTSLPDCRREKRCSRKSD